MDPTVAVESGSAEGGGQPHSQPRHSVPQQACCECGQEGDGRNPLFAVSWGIKGGGFGVGAVTVTFCCKKCWILLDYHHFMVTPWV